MDPLWVLAAFLFGVVASKISLPPLVGYLLAGFFLNSIGLESGETLAKISDAGVSDFWERIEPANSQVTLVMLTLPDPRTSIFAIHQMKKKGYKGQITASVRYEDERPLLKDEGIDAAYSLYEEAGTGFADHVCEHMDYCKLKENG